MEIIVRAPGVLAWNGREIRCALGPAGIRRDKREGDGATPAGRFPLRRVFYRPDRLDPVVTGLPCRPVRLDDGWCDHPTDPNYNRRVTLPYSGHCERLWRRDGLYDLLAVIGHNDDPVVKGRGSAIFLHVAQADYAPTAGCVAVALADLRALLAAADADSILAIEA